MVNTPSRLAQVLLKVWSLRAFLCTPRRLQRTLGSLLWISSPLLITPPWLAPVYHHLLHNLPLPSRILPLRPWLFLFTAFVLSHLPSTARALPPPCTMAPIFVDAAPFQSSFIVSMLRPHSFATTVVAPPWVSSQQDAEMYAIFHALRQASLLRLAHVCLYTDNMSVFYTLSSLRVSSFTPARARILRRIVRICLSSGIRFQMTRIPSRLNPADAFSRPPTIAAQPRLLTNPLFVFTHPTFLSSCAPLWARSQP